MSESSDFFCQLVGVKPRDFELPNRSEQSFKSGSRVSKFTVLRIAVDLG